MSYIMDNNEDISSLFKLPHEHFRVDNCGSCLILKFHTFYLKIYDGPEAYEYEVQGYAYDQPGYLIFRHFIRREEMRSYATLFKYEDGLRSFMRS